MKVSLNTIRSLNQRYGSANDVAAIGIDELVQKVGAQLGGVDEVIHLGETYQHIVMVRIVTTVPHPNADRLKVCSIDDGGVVQNVARDEDGLVQVVCGAPNAREGINVAWLPPGATVPETVGKDPFVLEARELRGVVSNGMLASPKELALSDNHDGILEIDGDIVPGSDFAETYGLKHDVVLDIENKMFTHRPDCFGFLGLAREFAGIQGLPYKSPDWYNPAAIVPSIEAEELPLRVSNEMPGLVPRFTAIAMSDVKVGPSPVWLQVELAKVGVRSINNIVDYTNFFMLETGQPIHAYDYDKVAALSGRDGAELVVRNPRSGETLELLNGKTIEPRAEAMVVATDKALLGLGGAMGGAETEISSETTNIIIEAATWDMYNMRRTAMAHGIFTDAVTRFTKGQSPLQNRAVVAKIVDEIRQYAGGKVASQLIDDNHMPASTMERQSLHPIIQLPANFINERLGLQLGARDIQNILQNVEFKVTTDSQTLMISAPFWRTDIELREDIVEEVGRLYGYDKLPHELPQRPLRPTPKNMMFELKAQVRGALSKGGANEVLTYSFVHGNTLKKAGQDSEKAFQISNALSPDLQYYRMSLTPSLLDKVHPNIKAGYDEFALFELGTAHIFGEQDAVDENVPKEVHALSFMYAAKKATAGAPYYVARKHLEELLATFDADRAIRFVPLSEADLYNNPWLEQMTAPFEPGRSAVLLDVLDGSDTYGLTWGVVGEYRASVRQAFKLPAAAAGFELDPLLLTRGQTANRYTALPRFPEVTQDITLKVPTKTTYQAVGGFVDVQLMQSRPENTLTRLSLVDVYQAEGDADHKNLTFRLRIASYDRTLTDKEVNTLLDSVAEAAKSELQAERI